MWSSSFVTQWKQELDASITLPNGNGIPVVLLGNKVSRLADARPGIAWSWGVSIEVLLSRLLFRVKKVAGGCSSVDVKLSLTRVDSIVPMYYVYHVETLTAVLQCKKLCYPSQHG